MRRHLLTEPRISPSLRLLLYRVRHLESAPNQFELADPLRDSSVVRVSSRDGSKVYYTGFTQLMPRPPRGRSEPLVSFGEAAPGMPVPIAVWYPRDDPSGRRFVYGETERMTAALPTTRR